ncbi:MAG TPA: hypothetical protein VJR23_15250 [Candidatus Acidoferrales bacterium]|nr:hypothetical protein [Candidatus Acidoferrales bacterium]
MRDSWGAFAPGMLIDRPRSGQPAKFFDSNCVIASPEFFSIRLAWKAKSARGNWLWTQRAQEAEAAQEAEYAEEMKEVEDVVEVEEKAEVRAICSAYYLFV